MNRTRRPKAIDLYCGAGGMSLGFEQAGFDIILGVDRDAYHCAAHERNFPYGKTLCISIENLKGEAIKSICNLEGELDLVFGGPPCQGFSTMGKRDAEDPRNSLVGEFVRLIRELKPKSFVMENVPGMQLGRTRAFFEFALNELADVGYRIREPVETLIASNFGAPQKRERLFILGIRKDLHDAPRYPRGPLPGQIVATKISDAFQGLPNIINNKALFDQDFLKFSPKQSKEMSLYSKVLCGLSQDKTDLSYPRALESGLIYGNKKSRHSPSSITLYRDTKPGEMVPGHKLPRLNPNGLSPTLRAGTESERGSHTAPRPIHPHEPRCITVREAARLHGYPDWFGFYPTVHHGFRQVGNSVSPFVARAVGYAVVEALGLGHGKLLKPKRILQLKNEFPLSKNGHKSERRITHLDEFTKVINHLFNSKFDNKSKSFNSPDISPDDISRAITESGGNLPRIRAENLLHEIAHSRNARQVIALPLKYGYSVVELLDGRGWKFVHKNTASAIGNKTSVSFSTGEIKNPVAIEIAKHSNGHVERTFLILMTTHIKNEFGDIIREADLFSSNQSPKQDILLKNGKGIKKGFVWIATRKASIKYELLKAIATEKNVDNIFVSIPLTERHLGVIILGRSGPNMIQKYKQVYYITDPAH